MTDPSEISIEHDADESRFYAETDEGDAELSYRMKGDDVVDFRHTYVPEELRESGIGGDLVRAGLEWATFHGYSVIPTCPFVTSFIEDNPRYQDLVVEE